MRIRKRRSALSVLRSIGTIFALIGIIFVVCGGITLKKDIDFKNSAVKVRGEITEIERYTYSSEGKTKTGHNVWVRYSVDGSDRINPINEYSSSMREGANIDLYYDPDSPDDVRTGMIIAPVIFLGIGGLFAVLGIIFISVNAAHMKRRKELMENGDTVTGVITAVHRNMTVKINNRHPYKAECEVIDNIGGKYLYSSENVTADITGLVGASVTVYVDRQDKGKYYVDIFEAIDRYNEDNNIHDFR